MVSVSSVSFSLEIVSEAGYVMTTGAATVTVISAFISGYS